MKEKCYGRLHGFLVSAIETHDGGEKSRVEIKLKISISHPNGPVEEAAGYESGFRLEPLGVISGYMIPKVIRLRFPRKSSRKYIIEMRRCLVTVFSKLWISKHYADAAKEAEESPVRRRQESER